MKKIIFLFVFMCVYQFSSAQGEMRRGYVGMSMGSAFASGDFKGNGAQGSLVNFGYLLSENFGIASSWQATVFPISNTNNVKDGSIGWGGILFGPMFSMPASNQKFNFDGRLLVGYGLGQIQNVTVMGLENEKPSAAAFGAGISTRWNFWKYMSFSVNFDYTTTKPHFGGSLGKYNMSSTAFTFGINYRLK